MQKVFILIGFLILSSNSGIGQLVDNFTDGNHTANPTWIGDVDSFIVNSSPALQLMANVAGTSHLSLPAETGDTATWIFRCTPNFSPSTNNQVSIYLSGMQSNLDAKPDGYFLRIGESGSNDAIELRVQNGASSSLVIRGTDGAVATASDFRVKVERSLGGLWQLSVDYNLDGTYTTEGTAVDNTFQVGKFFGFLCKYTVSNASNFSFDDVFISPIVIDNTPPSILSVNATSSTTVEVLFSEPLDPVSASDPTNYVVDQGIGNAAMAIVDAGNDALVQLTFSNPFVSGINYILTSSGVEDVAGNISSSLSAPFNFLNVQPALPFDIVINEMMPDPFPPLSLPEAEFVELYNRSAKNIELSTLILADATSQANLPAYVLPSGGYMILTKDVSVPDFQVIGPVLGMASFPSLNNSGDQVVIMDLSNTVIDALTYDLSWYGRTDRDDGGYSLERINPNLDCGGQANWRASESLTGGTPGKVNSIFDNTIDAAPAMLLRVYPNAANELEVFFDKGLDRASGEQVSNYQLSNGLGTALTATLNAQTRQSVVLTLPTSLMAGTIYTLTTSSGMLDCAGQSIEAQSVQFGLPEVIEVGDITINELLFNPFTGGVDFLELVNTSSKVLNLGDLILANREDGGNIGTTEPVTTDQLWLPGGYSVLTESAQNLILNYPEGNSTTYLEAETPTWGDSEGTVVVIGGGSILDEFGYTDELHFPLLDNQNGFSLEKLNPALESGISENWHSASSQSGGATPGLINSQFTELGVVVDASVSLRKDYVSPNGDGQHDLLFVDYAFPEGGAVLNANVFDVEGRLIKRLARSVLLAKTGQFSWNGLNESDERAKTGIHVLQVEILQISGSTQAYKLPFSVAYPY